MVVQLGLSRNIPVPKTFCLIDSSNAIFKKMLGYSEIWSNSKNLVKISFDINLLSSTGFILLYVSLKSL